MDPDSRQPADHSAAYVRAATQGGAPKVELKLFVAGMGPRSTEAVAAVEELCKTYGDACRVEIVDIYERPAAAAEAQIVAVPTLVRNSPLPIRRLIGAIVDIGATARSLGLAPPLPGGAQ